MRQLKALFNKLNIPRPLVYDWLFAAEADFEASLKPEFPRPTGRHPITLDRPSYNNNKAGVKNGRMMLSVYGVLFWTGLTDANLNTYMNSETVASFFEPCVAQIKDAVRKQTDRFAAEVSMMWNHCL